MKNTVILMLLGALAGVFIAAWVVPPALAWYTAPGGLPQGGQIQAVVQIPDVIRYATGKLIRWQWISAGIGAAAGLVLGLVFGSKSRRRQAERTPHTNQSQTQAGPL
jgi:hypothetical protein